MGGQCNLMRSTNFILCVEQQYVTLCYLYISLLLRDATLAVVILILITSNIFVKKTMDFYMHTLSRVSYIFASTYSIRGVSLCARSKNSSLEHVL